MISQILVLLKKTSGLGFGQVMKKLGIASENKEQLKKNLQLLENQGRILRIKNKYFFNPGANVVTGIFTAALKGFGFVLPDKPFLDDIFVPARHAGGAVHGDTVEVKFTKSRKEGKLEGRILRILKKGKQSLIGIYRERSGQSYFLPSDMASLKTVPLSLGRTEKPVPGSVIKVSREKHALEEVFGLPDEEGVDLKVVMHKHGYTRSFPSEVVSEVKRIGSDQVARDLSRRKDFTQWTTMTIDGEDARDFDDAVSITKLAGKKFIVGIHIADVSDYVLPGTHLDAEALQRGQSVYFPEITLPMLPEKLSFDMCSLKPGEIRKTISTLLTLDSDGKILETSFHHSLIKTRARLTYGSVQMIFDGEKNQKRQYSALVSDLLSMREASFMLRDRRIASGSVDFDLPEPELIKGQDHLYSVTPAVRNDAHRLIEEFMLAANEAVACFLSGKNIPLIYRIHPVPPAEDLNRLREFLKYFGFSLPLGSEIRPVHLQHVLDNVKGSPLERLVAMKVLRSFPFAVYSDENEGHFGLGKEYYTHFTSPIRRYPDLIVHRILKKNLQKEKMEKIPLAVIAKHCSEQERQADEAERDLMEWRIFRILKTKLGDVFRGIIVGITKAGLMIELEGYFVEGTMGFMDLPRDVYVRSENMLFGRRTGRVFELGHKINIKLVSVDPFNRKMTLIPA